MSEVMKPEDREPDYRAAMLYHSDRADGYMVERDALAARIADLERQLAEAQALIYAARQERNAAEDAEKELAEELRTVKRQLAEAREVKPLEWEDFYGRGAKASAFYQANYLIQKWSGEGRFEVSMSYPGYQTGYDGPRWHPTLEAAKAAAQADYTARILAALREPK